MIALCFIYAYICEFYFGYNYGIAFIYDSLISFFAGLPFFVLFMKDQKEINEKKEQNSDLVMPFQQRKVQHAYCYICNNIAEGSCYHCDKPVCKDHLTTLKTLSFCTKCIDQTEALKKKLILLVLILMIAATLFFIMILFNP